MIFFRAAWMEHYDGLDNDEINTGASWVKTHGFCHEMYNFKQWNGKFLGSKKVSNLSPNERGAFS